jgi:hypothetical protein
MDARSLGQCNLTGTGPRAGHGFSIADPLGLARKKAPPKLTGPSLRGKRILGGPAAPTYSQSMGARMTWITGAVFV